MTQYNLKLGLRKFGTKGATAAMDKLTQPHVMDPWTAMDLSKLMQENQMRALSLLLFLKKSKPGNSKEEHALMELCNKHIY